MELADDLQRFIAGEPVIAYPEGPWEQAWRWAHRHRVAVSARTAAAVVVLGLGTFAVVKLREAERNRIEAVRIAENLAKQDQAHRDLKTFRQLADEASFYAATTDMVAENAPYFDPQRARRPPAHPGAHPRLGSRGFESLPIAKHDPTRLDFTNSTC